MNNNEILQNNVKLIDDATKDIKAFMSTILDDASFVETDVFTCGASFIDGAEALGEGVVTGYATIGGNPVQIFAQNANVLKGSISDAHAKKIVKTINKAINTGTPIISIIDSCGARIGEGVSVLEAYAKIVAAAVDAESEVPHICIVKGYCVGMMSSFASLADFVFMAEDATLSFGSPMVLTSGGNSVPAKFSDVLGLKAHTAKNPIANFSFKTAKDLGAKLNDLMNIILASEDESNDDPNRETLILDKSASVDNLFAAICDNEKFVEFSSAFATDVRCVLTKVNGISVGLLATDSTKNDGFLSQDGIIKATSFIGKLNGLNIPLITLIDSKGANSCLDCEIKGFAKISAELMATISTSVMPKIGVVVGKAIGYAYAALASKAIGFDYSIACASAEISPINSETAVNLVYADELKKAKDPIAAREKLAKKYADTESNPFISAKDGFIDNIISASTIRPYISSALLMLLGI